MADATEAAQELAAEHGIDLDTVEGTGVDGRIIADDVRAVIPEPTPEENTEDGPQDWPQGKDYDPRTDSGPVRPEDGGEVEESADESEDESE